MITNRAIEILAECADLMKTKNKDYVGSSTVTDEDYYRYDTIPGLPIMNQKLLRYISTMEQDSVNHESADDSLRDLINYAARTIAYNEQNTNEDNICHCRLCNEL